MRRFHRALFLLAAFGAVYAAEPRSARRVFADESPFANPEETTMANRDDLEVLKQITGSEYEKQRDFLLQSGDLEARLGAAPASGDWHDGITRRILAGWIQHATLYRRVLAELDAVDVAQESRKITGIAGVWEAFADRAASEYKTDILPLCWEVLLKRVEDWPDWKLVAFLRATAAVPAAESVEPVLWFLQRTGDAQLQDVAGQTLERLPKDTVVPRLERLEDKHAHVVEILREVKGRLD